MADMSFTAETSHFEMSPVKGDPRNILSIVVTDATFQAEMSPLNEDEYANIASISVTEATFQAEMSPLNEDNWNIRSMSFTAETSHLLMPPVNEE
eukprot:1474963-Rhodomonas_salina.2